MRRFGTHFRVPAATAKVKLGPTGSFGRDALRRVLAAAAKVKLGPTVCWPEVAGFATDRFLGLDLVDRWA